MNNRTENKFISIELCENNEKAASRMFTINERP